MKSLQIDQLSQEYNIAIVIPAFCVEHEIESVLLGIPKYVSFIIVVDDCSQDHTCDVVSRVAKNDNRITLIRHTNNQGVGGAMISGFRKALELGAQIVAKLDGDGQMDPSFLCDLIFPLVNGDADYAKGNRFRDFAALQQMPFVRRFGNVCLGFLTKIATGYWNIFDPTNGYVAIRGNILNQLQFGNIDKTYYFETSMLSNLYLIDAKVVDVSMPARYGKEISNLRILHVLLEFPLKLLINFFRRIILKYFVYDLSMVSIYIVSGIPLFLFGLLFGLLKWIKYSNIGVAAPTGTVILPTLSLIIGIQFIISAINIDINAVPLKAISRPLNSNSYIAKG
jgi:glycosyltransferase involved in cell wall biosynthesis